MSSFRQVSNQDKGTHWCLRALDLSPNIISKSEVSLRIKNLASDLQIWLCREHRINDHFFDGLGCRRFFN